MGTDTPGTGDTLPTGSTDEDVVAPDPISTITPNLDDTVLASDISEQIALDDPNNPPPPIQSETTRIGSTEVNQNSH